MIIAHKMALDPNNVQATYFKNACNVARFVSNWALAEWQRQYQAYKADPSLPKPSEGALRRPLNAIKREQFPCLVEVTKCATQRAILQLGIAFENFFTGRPKYPRFRRKGVHDRFTLTNDQFSIDGCRIRIPNFGWVRMSEPLRLSGKIISAPISRVAEPWFVGLTEPHTALLKRLRWNTRRNGVAVWWLCLTGPLQATRPARPVARCRRGYRSGCTPGSARSAVQAKIGI